MSFPCLFRRTSIFKSLKRTELQSSWKNINHININGDWCLENDVIQGRTVDYDIWVQSPLRCCCFKAEEFSWKNINHIKCRTVDYDTVGGHIFLRISSTNKYADCIYYKSRHLLCSFTLGCVLMFILRHPQAVTYTFWLNFGIRFI